MVKLVLLFLLVAVGSSTAWPYSNNAERIQEMLSAELENENRHALANYYDDAEVATYSDDAEMADDDDEDLAMAAYDHNNVAEINRRRGKHRRYKKRNPCKCKLTIYAEANYQGRSLVIREQNANFKNDNFDNKHPESLKIAGKCPWVLYKDANFEGASFIVMPGKRYPTSYEWGHSGISIGSARALPPKGTRAIVLFKSSHFNRQMVVLKKSTPDLTSLDFYPDYAPSYVVSGGRWTLFEDANYKGKNVTCSTKVVSEASIGLDGIKSVKRK